MALLGGFRGVVKFSETIGSGIRCLQGGEGSLQKEKEMLPKR